MKQMLFVLASATWASANLDASNAGNLCSAALIVSCGELAVSLLGLVQYVSSIASFPDVETLSAVDA